MSWSTAGQQEAVKSNQSLALAGPGRVFWVGGGRQAWASGGLDNCHGIACCWCPGNFVTALSWSGTRPGPVNEMRWGLENLDAAIVATMARAPTTDAFKRHSVMVQE